MKNFVIRLLQNTWGLLIFALLSGCAYFAVIVRFIISNTEEGGALLSFFLLPLIVCGAALVLCKTIKKCFEDESYGKAAAIFWAHIAFMIIAGVLLASMYILK